MHSLLPWAVSRGAPSSCIPFRPSLPPTVNLRTDVQAITQAEFKGKVFEISTLSLNFQWIMHPCICIICLDIANTVRYVEPMYIDVVPNRNSPPAVLLREAWRKGKKTCKRTLANLSDWPKEKIETFRRLLRDEPLVSPLDLFATQKTLPHGHVQAVREMIAKLELDRLISAQHCRERDLVVAMIVQRLIAPCSKLATTRRWHTTTLADELGVAEATENDLYEAMDWLLERQERIEKKLAARHLSEGGLVLYDVSSSFYEGRTCPLAQFGHDRDGKNGLPIIVYGVMTNGEGCPVAVSVYAGNTGDPSTVADQIKRLREKFGLQRVVMVGDRGMLTQPQIDKLKQLPGLGWITALTSTAIRGAGGLAAVAVGSEESGRDHRAGLSGGAADGVSQPGAGGAAQAKEGGVTASHGEELGEDQQGSGAAEKEALHGGRDWCEGGEGAGTLQNGQAFCVQHRRGQLGLESSCGIDHPGRKTGWDLCAAHQRAGGTTFGRRHGAELQEPGGSGTSLSLFEGDRSVGAADTASHGGSRAGAHFSVHVGLLRGMAPAPSLGAAVVRG